MTITAETWLASIAHPEHRAYAELCLADLRGEKPSWAGAVFPGVSRAVRSALWDDACLIVRGWEPGWEPRRYHDHISRQQRIQSRRKATLELRRRAGFVAGFVAPRDSQRSRLYRAESNSQGRWGRRLETVEEMQAYVDALLADPWTKERWPTRRIRVGPGRGYRRATAISGYNKIEMPRWARCEHVVLHEVAHLFTDRQYGVHVASHGWQFAGILVQLVEHQLGEEAATALKASFAEHRVRWKKPRQRRSLTAEQKAAAIERLVVAREVGAAKRKETRGG